ncbi:acyltransferase family protein [Streptococcus saliviloxodontae]|uniref:Surface polysaccharide O-acyltransferase-like enzyme n=1 Tax=Streptococcus saliviloxodontae TaxID=1349416 RepID=A0ABS2PL90_9STRE|nr:acyltransferase family protein [Streptococcus saliviloxodontae]MBM7636042.1 surface polysaccharide O-acyltransferase-like enzyme [Streptococcus saliviloxodontae]
MIKTIKNKGRQLEFDVAKVFAIFFMVLIHVYETINGSENGVLASKTWEIFLEFVGGPLAAPIFMLAMGVGMVYTRHNTTKDFAKRGVQLLGLGYLLNFLRGVFPLLLGNFVTTTLGWQLAENRTHFNLLENLMTVDILPFAGLTFLLVALLKQLRFKTWQMLLLALILSTLGMTVGRLTGSHTLETYVVGLLFYFNQYTSFPLTLWFVYPIFGMFFGELLQQTDNKDRFYQTVLQVALVTFITITAVAYYFNIDYRYFFTSDFYYQQNPLSTLWTLSIVLIAMYLYYQLSKLITSNFILSWTKFIGSNLNQIYIIHWLIIPYIVGFVGNITPITATLLSLCIMLFSICIRKGYLLLKDKDLQ